MSSPKKGGIGAQLFFWKLQVFSVLANLCQRTRIHVYPELHGEDNWTNYDAAEQFWFVGLSVPATGIQFFFL